ncbi:MAG: secretin N-terminal domain-containing protein [Planctomycetota bacterium]
MFKKHHRRHNWGWVLGTTGALLASPAFGQSDGFDEIYDASEGGETPIGLFDVADGDADDGAVNMDSFGKVDLAVKDLEIAKVLQLLSIQSQKNIVTSRNVSGTVSADLYGVTFHEALDAILEPNGFGYEEKGNFIYVYTAEELQERKDASRETVTRIIRLNYLNGTDAKTIAEAMLSDAGSVTFSSESSDGFMPSETDAGGNGFALPDSVIIRDYEENVAAVESLISELDVRPKQVLIEATILQAQLTENNAFGVDFSVFSNLNAFDFGNPLSLIDDLIDGNGPDGDSGGGVQSTVGNTSGPGGVKVGYVGSDAAVFVRALDSVTDTTVVAKPNILVLNRQKADLLVGQRLGYLSTTVTDTSNTQTVEFLDVGTQLTVRPFVSNEGTVRLELRPAISDGAVREQAGFVIPDETTQELITNIIVEDGQTVVIGGLFKEDTTNSRDQVPGLGDVPLLGTAFQGKDDTVERSEVIFLIKTTIMEPSALTLGGEAAQEAIRNKRLGAKQGLLPWSTDKLVSSNLLTARKALEDGNTKKALWHTNLALHISPVAADALALKQEITGEEIRYQDRSQLQGIMDAMIDADVEAVAPAAQNDADEEMESIDASLGEAEESIEADMTETETVEIVEEPATDEVAVEAGKADEQVTEAAIEEPAIDDSAADADVAEQTAQVVSDDAFEFDFDAVETQAPATDAPGQPEVTAEVEPLSNATDTQTAPEFAEVDEFAFEWAEVDAESSVSEPMETAEVDDSGLFEVIEQDASPTTADDEWAFDFPVDESGDAPTASAEAADVQAVELDPSFFEPTGADVPDFATELTQVPDEAVDVPTETEATDQDPVFNYYEQLMSEVETSDQ